MSELLIFDVNETLLDLAVLRPHFKRTFRSEQVMGEYYSMQDYRTSLKSNCQ